MVEDRKRRNAGDGGAGEAESRGPPFKRMKALDTLKSALCKGRRDDAYGAAQERERERRERGERERMTDVPFARDKVEEEEEETKRRPARCLMDARTRERGRERESRGEWRKAR